MHENMEFLRKSSSRIHYYFKSDYLIEFALSKNQCKFDQIIRIKIGIIINSRGALSQVIKYFYSDSTKILILEFRLS